MMGNILIIEPDRLLGRNYLQALEQAGHTALWERTGQGAIHSLDEALPDVIVLELQLPSHSGIEFLYELRSYVEWQNIPIIIQSSVSAAAFTSDETILAQLGIAAYLYKPQAKLHHLIRTIEHVLQPVIA